MAKRGPESRRLIKELTAELQRNGAAAGDELEFDASEQVVINLIADAVDRRAELRELYDAAEGAKLKVQLSSEIRLLDGSIERLLRRISTALPAPMSPKSKMAQRAANARWHGPAGRLGQAVTGA